MCYSLLLILCLNDIQLPESCYIKAPTVGHSSSGRLYLGDKYGTKVLVLDGSTSRVLIHSRDGQGPGEFAGAWDICAFEEAGVLLIAGKHGDISLFKIQDGSFVKKIKSFMPYESLHRFSNNSFLVIWGKDGENKIDEHHFAQYNLDGNVLKKWQVSQPQWQKNYIYESPRAFAVGPNGKVYIGMWEPEVREYAQPYNEPSYWKLKPPQGYAPPPKKALTRSEMFDKEKLSVYLESFSFVLHVFCDDRRLFVFWAVNVVDRSSVYDVYDLASHDLLKRGVSFEGKPLAAQQDKLYFLHTSDEQKSDDQQFVRVHPIGIKK